MNDKVKTAVTPAAQASGKAIDATIKKAGAAYGKARDLVQAAAVAIIEHAEAYGDCTRAIKLARVVPARERNSLIGFFAMFSPIGIAMGKTAADDKCRFIKPESTRYNRFNVPAAKSHNWYDDPAGENAEPKPLNTIGDVFDKIDAMLKSAIKDASGDEAKRYDPSVAAPCEALRKTLQRSRAAMLGAMTADTANDGEGDNLPVGREQVAA